ncbi:MAG TPA: peptide-methionine (R)-S-oxide reductase MsrB [Pyrinomonadaceae bacterium]|jgi:methionine-R-sulfoxide reductase|nr:peptide-methionine (R)-S-oxide reductase MsrB [Pyrinomonadaceae bacterium]
MNRRYFIKSGATLGMAAVLFRVPFAETLAQRTAAGGRTNAAPFKKIIRTDEEWRRILTAEQYRITRQKGTEAPGASPLLKNYAKGTYVCVGCALPLFSSKTKYDSHTGWPSFWAPIAKRNVREEQDTDDGMTRTEVLCNRCDAHLGHVFDDGPDPTGLRYCMNGAALKFVAGAARS